MEPCMNSNALYNCSEASPVFNVTKPSWCERPSTTDGPSTTITDGPSTTITDIITTLVSDTTTFFFTNQTISSKVPTTTVTEPTVTVTTETPEPTEGAEVEALSTGEIIGIVAAVVAVFVIIIIIVLYWNKKKKRSDEQRSRFQSQKSTIGLTVGIDEPDGEVINKSSNSKENETLPDKFDESYGIEDEGQSKNVCNVEVKLPPIVQITEL